MTPKEKAQELFNTFSDIEHLGVNGKYNGNWEWSSFLWRKQSKQCALIAVDEILQAVESDWSFMEVRQDYWKEVKQEIENL
jgi:hypothetical protein